MSQRTIDIPTFLSHYKNGLSDNQIGKLMDFHPSAISYQRRKHGFKPNRTVRAPLKRVGKNKAQCSKCLEIQHISQFTLNRKGGPYVYNLSYCNNCRREQVNQSLSTSVDRFLIHRWGQIKRKCLTRGWIFNIDKLHLIAVFKQQMGKCLYTDEELVWGTGKGRRRNALSVDCIERSLGYIPGNVVLCTSRANSIKSDLTLDEMAKWMPDWHSRILKFRQSFADAQSG